MTSSDEMLHDDILMTPGIIFDFDFCFGLLGGYARLRQRRQGPLRLQIRQESRIQSFRKIFGLMMGPRVLEAMFDSKTTVLDCLECVCE